MTQNLDVIESDRFATYYDDQRFMEEDASTCRFVRVVIEPQTYRNLAYHLLSLPLGILAFVVFLTGISVGLVSALFVVGLVTLFGTVRLGLILANIERLVANCLLRTDIPRFHRVAVSSWREYLALVRWDAVTRRRLLFVALRFPLGLVAFVGTVVALAFAIAALSFPLLVLLRDWLDLSLTMRIAGNELDSVIEWIIWAIVAPSLALSALHLSNACAGIWSELAETLLTDRDDV